MKFAAAALIVLSLFGAGLYHLHAPAPVPAPVVAGWPVVRGSVGGEPVHWYVAFEQGDGVQLCLLEHVEGERPCQELSGLPLSELRTMPLQTWAKGSTLWLTERFDGEVPATELKFSSYVNQLVEGSRAPKRSEGYEPTVVSAVEQFKAARTWAEADAWAKLWSEQHRHDDVLFEAFIRHQAVGECSQDETPQLTARLFAELAFARGDLPTFIDLQLRLVQNSFERVAWSGFAEERQPTVAGRLSGTGVELDRLFEGLLIRHPGAKASVDDWRLARAIRETGRTDAMLPRVEALATMPSLDAYNRFRATEVWLHLQVYDETTRLKLEVVKAAGRRLDLHPISRLRLDAAL